MPHPRRWSILAFILVAECMDLLDATIVNVAVPSIRGDFHASESQVQWIVGAYPLAVAVGLILGARLGDLYGRRRLFALGAFGFTAASLACALAPSAGLLIAGRLVQGGFAALMIPQGLGILRSIFPPDELPKAYGIFGPVIGSAAIVGPIVGGALVDANLFGTGWRLVFLVNLPLGAAAVVGALRLMPEGRAAHARRLDIGGTVLVSAAMALLVYPLIEGREAGWPAWTYGSIAAGLALLVVFAFNQVWRLRTGRDPLVEPSLFAHRGYTAGIAVMQIFFAAISGFMLTLMLFLQLGQSYSPLRAGLTLAPWALGTAIGAGFGGAVLVPRFGRTVLQLGAAVSVAGTLLLLLVARGSGELTTWTLLPGILVSGLGLGLVVAPLFDIVLAAVSERELGSASGVINASQQLASSLGIAVIGTVFFGALAGGRFHHALTDTLWLEAALFAASLVLTPLLPRQGVAAEALLLAAAD
ncbi:MAG TPA: DHA2 family efflux MFS transporter permease subunit [Gaiellaceae bacterium]|nr:DHA2 family efflux MFS transporter permease subunit [Gaiellaceae bacterium]